LPYFVAQIVTCSISFGLWPHVVGLNEQNKYHIISYHREAWAGARIHCKLFSFYLTLGHHATQSEGELEAMNIAIRQTVSRIGPSKRLLFFSDSSAAIHSLTKVDEVPSKRVTEIH